MNNCCQGSEKRIADVLKPYIVPVYFAHNGKLGPSPDNIFSNATMTLLDTGERKLFVTCYHVWEKFQKYKAEDSGTLMLIGRGDGEELMHFNDAEYVDGDKDNLDIAILSFPYLKEVEKGEKRFYKAKNWPPENVSKGEVVGFLGYPGVGRGTHKTDRKGIFSGIGLWVDFVTSVSDRHSVIADEKNEREREVYINSFKESGALGGISGSSVYVFRDKEYVLVGFVYEGGEGMHSPVFASHASFINANGKIDRQNMPWL